MKINFEKEVRRGLGYIHSGWMVEGYDDEGNWICTSGPIITEMLERAEEFGMLEITLTQLIDENS